MLFLKTISHFLQIINNLILTVSKTLLLVFKLVKRELNLTWFTIQSVLGLTSNQVFSNRLAYFLTKKNHFLRDFVFLWQFNNPTNNNTKMNFTSRYTDSTQLKTSSVSEGTLHSTFYKTITGNPFLFKMYNNTISQEFDLYWIKLKFITWLRNLMNRSFGFGFYYIQGFVFVLFIDACLTDDEPLWEPIEWSLVQTWILFIFSFAWVAENLIVSRYGSYTGRDKRVWMSWYKTFWLIEGYYVINYGVAIVFVIIPFYFETNYNLSFVYSWWHWYSRVFFFKFLSLFSLILLISYYLQMTVRWLNWKKGLFLVLLINIFLSYLIYTQFLITFFGFFTDPVWYQKNPTNRLYSTEPWACSMGLRFS